MKHVRSVLAIVSILFLSSCQASVAGPQVIDLPLLDVRFTYPVPPLIREQNGEYLLRANGTNMFASNFQYHQTSKNIDDWTITTAIRDALLKNPTCDILKDKRVYLPVDTRKRMHCTVVRADASEVVIAAIGYGIPDAAMDFLQSMIVILRPKDVVLMTGVTPFPRTHDAIQAMTDTFPASHPKLPVPAWPNRGFHFLAIDVRTYLETQLNPPSLEVTANQEQLLGIARSIVRTDGESPKAPAR